MAAFKDYQDHDGLGLAALVRTRQVKPEEVLEAALACIARHNPKVNALTHLMEAEARRTVAAGLPEGPFRGVPYALKDLNVLYAGQPTTNGSRLFAGFVPDHDSTLTERCRAAGLVIVGKTNTPELGLNMTTEPALHGPTRNPYDLALSAGGSSGGAAAAVASGMMPMAHATDGGGSIRIPAANCGLVGLKTTRARNPMGPDVAEGLGGLSVGHCVSRTVRDSAALLDATHGPAPGDPYAAPPPARPFLDEVGADPGRLRIGLVTEAPGGLPVDAACRSAAEEAGRMCAGLGHHVEPATLDVDVEALLEAFWSIFCAGVRFAVDQRLKALQRPLRPDDIEPASHAFAEAAARVGAADYLRGIHALHAAGRRIARTMAKLDVLLLPTLAQPPMPLGTLTMAEPDGRRYFDALFRRLPFTPAFNASGQPAIQLPLVWTDKGIPIGVQFAGRLGDEATLLRLAAQLEAAHPWAKRRPPLFG